MSSRTALSPVMSSPGRPRAERGGRPEPAMMIAPALPCPAAVESVLRIAAIPVAPAVTAGEPIGAATAAAPAVVAAVCKRLLNAPAISCPPASSPEAMTFWNGQEIVRRFLNSRDWKIRRFASRDICTVRCGERLADAGEQAIGVVEHGVARIH